MMRHWKSRSDNPVHALGRPANRPAATTQSSACCGERTRLRQPSQELVADCAACSEKAGEPFSKAAIGCNRLQFSIVEWIERPRLSSYHRHVGPNALPAAVRAAKQLQPFQPFESFPQSRLVPENHPRKTKARQSVPVVTTARYKFTVGRIANPSIESRNRAPRPPFRCLHQSSDLPIILITNTQSAFHRTSDPRRGRLRLAAHVQGLTREIP